MHQNISRLIDAATAAQTLYSHCKITLAVGVTGISIRGEKEGLVRNVLVDWVRIEEARINPLLVEVHAMGSNLE